MELPSYLPKSHLFIDEDLPRMFHAGAFGMWKAWKKTGRDKLIGTYDVTIREFPKNRNFLVFTGLEEIVKTLLTIKFPPEHIQKLLEYKLIDEEMADELANFKYKGDLWAMKEGEIFFPGEPILKFRAPLYQLELLYLYLINVIPSNTSFSSKAIRITLAAQDKSVVLFGARAHSLESAWKTLRSFYICGGIPSGSHFFYLNKVNMWPPKLLNALTHAFIKSYPSEIEAMKAFAETFPNDEAIILVDTYNYEKGVDNFIKVAKELKSKGKKLNALYIDSGDYVKRSEYAREKLDEAGLNDVKIFVSGNLDEWKIKEFLDKGIKADMFAVATELVTLPDDPKLEVVWKAANIIEKDGTVRNVMKLSPGKKSYPGNKQVFRRVENNVFKEDIIGLVEEGVNGEELLTPIIKNGELNYQLPKLEKIRNYVKNRVELLPTEAKDINKDYNYPVRLSSGLEELIKEVTKHYE